MAVTFGQQEWLTLGYRYEPVSGQVKSVTQQVRLTPTITPRMVVTEIRRRLAGEAYTQDEYERIRNSFALEHPPELVDWFEADKRGQGCRPQLDVEVANEQGMGPGP
jgi:hypothetical protein